MAILSNGTTEIEILYVDEKITPSLDKVNKVSSGGDLKQQVGGERLSIKCEARVSSTLFRSIMDLLKDRSEQYFYTTETDHPFYSGVTQPIPVQIDKIGQSWDNRQNHYIHFDLKSTSYI